MHQVLRAREVKKLPTSGQLRHLPKILTKSEKRIALGAVAVIIVAGAVLGFNLFYAKRVEAPAFGGEYTEGLIGAPQLINPLYSLTSDVDTDLSRLIYSGIMQYDSQDGLIYDLAESVDISEDETVYTIKLRDDAKWHDGYNVRAEDVVFTFSAMQNPDYRSPLLLSFSGVRVEQVDDLTVRFTLEEPLAPFLSMLTIGILPSHIWEAVSPINATLTELNKKPVGSGPYQFEKLVRDSGGTIRTYTLTANRDYYRGSPNIEFLHFKFYSDMVSAVDALKNRNVEGLSYLPLEYVKDIESDNSLSVQFPTLPQYTASFFNQDNSDALSDSDIRKALALATDKEAIIESALGGYGKSIDSFVLEGMIGEHPDIATIEFDLEAAKSQLEEAGWTLEEGAAVRTKDGVALELSITALNSSDLAVAAEELARQWTEAGILASTRLVGSTEFSNDILRDRNYQVLLSGELYGIDPDPYAFWHSSQTDYPGLNLSGLSNRNADEYIETGRSTIDTEARAEAYRALQDIVAEEVSAIFIYQPLYAFATSNKIQNIDVRQIIVPADRFSRVNEWYIKTRRVIKK
ncbi:MAG: peptide ABC transporter substrate-binding protein [bacterium]